MANKKPSVIDDVLSRVRMRKPGFAPWYERLPEDLRNELETLRRRWHAGELTMQKRSLCVAVAEVVADRGHQEPGIQAVITWLNRKP